jgi:hypothetical protein
MKKDLRMNARSPDPDDLSDPAPPDRSAKPESASSRQSHREQPDVSAPHVPPGEDGKIKGEEDAW